MRALALAAFAALIACASLAASAQPAADTSTSGELRLTWEVKNRFRLFRNEPDFQRQAAAARGTVLATERQLSRESDGRGWARDMLDRLCVDGTGKLVETCVRDGEREDYLAPADHRIVIRLAGRVPADATCVWGFQDSLTEPRRANTSCSEEVRLRVAYGVPTIVSVGVTRADGTVESVTTEVRVRDVLIAGLGDSVASGEGNPDRAVTLSDEGFCFRRFLGTGRSEYFRPSRAGYKGDKACDDMIGGDTMADFQEWSRHGARWMSASCHRSLYSYQLRAALALAVENPQVAVTFIPLACTGASISAGLFGSQRTSDCPPTGRCVGSLPGQISQLQDLLASAHNRKPDRALDLLLLTIGANDIRFSGLVADVIVSSGVERTLFRQGGMMATVPESQRLLERELPADFAKLRNALKPLVGGDLRRVVFVSYGNPAAQGEAPCAGGKDGFDIHPAFDSNPARLKQVSDYTVSQFLPMLKVLARCDAANACRDPASERMTFVDGHQPAFAAHGICARAPDDPPFDRECFSPNGTSFDNNPISGATSPLTCGRRPGEFRAYASRARWIRTANDSYFTAMTFAQGLPSTMQPNKLHDAMWGATSAVYGGAVHPTAEGHAAMADAALPAARALLGLRAPPAVTAEPLPIMAR